MGERRLYERSKLSLYAVCDLSFYMYIFDIHIQVTISFIYTSDSFNDTKIDIELKITERTN